MAYASNYVPVEQRPRTYFIDIDGTIIRQGVKWESHSIAREDDSDALPGSVDVINDLYTAGHTIVLTTARAQSWKGETERQLRRIGLQWHLLICGLPTGQRVVINDHKPAQSSVPTAFAINIKRDVGLEGVELWELR